MQAHTAKFLFTFCIFVAGTAAAKHDLPSYFPRCKRFDPKLNDCLLKATETVRPFLVKGVPELGLPTIEPFVITEISLKQNTRALNFTAYLKNVEAKGLSSYKFSELKFDVPNLEWGGKLSVDKIEMEGDYNATGTVLSAPIRGKGRFVAGITRCDITISQKMKLIQKKQLDYLKTVSTKTTIQVREPTLKLDGLFDGDAESNRVTNNIITSNINELFEDLRPVIEEVIANIAEAWMARAIENNIPFDKLYPKD